MTEVVTFSEPMNTSLTPSIDLFGEFRNVHYAAASETWDSTGTVLTIKYNNLPSDAYQFNLYASGFQDLAGNHAGQRPDDQLHGHRAARATSPA